MNRKKAKSKVKIDNSSIRVTEFIFEPGEETGMHKHEFDYVVTPITSGELLLIDKNGKKNNFDLSSSQPYFRYSGVEHNVINIGNKKIIFIELEIKNNKEFL